VARQLEVHGVVQGVGFRPFVYRLGHSLGVDGWVRNEDGRVVVGAAGPPNAVADLAARLRSEAPPYARVVRVTVTDLSVDVPPQGSGFRIETSAGRPSSGPASAREIPPDLATCGACLAELSDPGDRRYRYPFLTCTDCGPRATIIDALPYDRERTTMHAFTMCGECAREYADPADRRFHAEPIACPACGPQLTWWARDGHGDHLTAGASGAGALAAAEELIRSGGILAVKGLGGYQLVCDATDEEAVARLRARKHRPAKPFAVMVADVGAARRLAHVDADEMALLTSVARPVVLVQGVQTARHGGGTPGAGASTPEVRLAPGVAAGAPRLGLFLPCTPLHHLLLADLRRPLVVTSGNRAEEPISIGDTEAAERLGAVADAFLAHDRAIRSRYDDSVTRVVAGRPSVIRRARGYAPEPLPLPRGAGEPVLAVGAQLKHTFTLAHGTAAFVGPHTGDLEQQATMEAFESNVAHLSALVGIAPRVVAHDLHPGYLSTRYAAGLPAHRRIAVQHHHAHVASCAAEHGVAGRFIGVAYDGLGLGDDGTFWGGEVLVADLASYRRVARFGCAPLPGGAAAVRRPARMALGYLFGAEPLGGVPGTPTEADLRFAAPFLSRLPAREVAVVRKMIERGVNCPVASSAGRLFDAAAALLGLRDDATYEGEAAVALEAVARRDTTPQDTGTTTGATGPGAATAGPSSHAGELPWRVVPDGGLFVYDPRPTLRALLAGLHDHIDAGVLAARFHATIVAVTVALCTDIARMHGLRTVCLSGGVLQNQRIAGALLGALADAGLNPLLNQRVPVNDGGISYGQAAVTAARLGNAPRRGEDRSFAPPDAHISGSLG
jgi:hydrogenase maturation protein HypF